MNRIYKLASEYSKMEITEKNFTCIIKYNFAKWLRENLSKMTEETQKEVELYLNPTEVVKSETDHYRQRRLMANSTRAYF